jgi:hypothetical protein
MSSPIQFTRATRQAVKLKLAVQGPSGSGKTLGALALAQALAKGGKVAVVDTENGSAALYADRFAFDTIVMHEPYETKKYQAAVKAAIDAGYVVVVVDSLSHQWAGAGGILSRKEQDDQRPGSNSYTNWARYTKEHEAFKAFLVNAPIHLVATMRSKQDYILETNDKGKAQPKKVGFAPIQREGMEYEFAVVFELQMDHRAAVSKDRTGLFEGTLSDLCPEAGENEVAQSLLGWLDTAAPVEPNGNGAGL